MASAFRLMCATLALSSVTFAQPLGGKSPPIRGPIAPRGRPSFHLPEAAPESVGIDRQRLARLDEVVAGAVEDGEVPGAVVLVGHRGRVVYRKAFGWRQTVPSLAPMSVETLFDLASLTKPVATATACMLLIERGRLRLDDRIGWLDPSFDNHGKGEITLEQLLRHRTGLIADNPLSDYESQDRAWGALAELGLEHLSGDRFLYSDVNFILLGRILEHQAGESIARLLWRDVFEPLEMDRTRFGIDPEHPDDDIAPNEAAPTERGIPAGVVHDPRARALGGRAGHAGLFSTADDLALYAQMLLNEGVGANGARILSPLTVRAMTSPGDTPEGERRGLGWDIDTGYSSPRGDLFGPRSFGHTGFTGTSLWIDPETKTFVILLTSRLHPDGDRPSPTALRARVANVVAASILDPVESPPAGQAAHGPASPLSAVRPVRCGIDVLRERGFEVLDGKRVGLITNHTGLADEPGSTRSTKEVLWSNASRANVRFELVALFSPEHGIRGRLDEKVGHGEDESTGLPIYSLYGETRKPTPEMLEGVDVLVYDIQDIGARFYTYISTLGLALEAAQERGIPMVVLDRPNPIGGVAVGGPVRDDEFASFIAYHALPVRHGMTVGELARLYNAERKINAELFVIPCEGWERGDLYDRTGLTWVDPSPNMRSLTEALLYPGVGLLETTNLATGRGTDTPFERVGAPWIDAREFSEALNRSGLPGVRFTPIHFQPTERQYAGVECHGVYLMITDRQVFDPIALGIEMAVTLRRLYGGQWNPEGFLNMLGDRRAYEALLEGRSREEIMATWDEEIRRFERVRREYLIYQ
jgi:uncharacterized protein YbbC (DUF1343 family)/CubicO group peptidase (beta-lactamase class C family)